MHLRRLYIYKFGRHPNGKNKVFSFFSINNRFYRNAVMNVEICIYATRMEVSNDNFFSLFACPNKHCLSKILFLFKLHFFCPLYYQQNCPRYWTFCWKDALWFRPWTPIVIRNETKIGRKTYFTYRGNIIATSYFIL